MPAHLISAAPDGEPGAQRDRTDSVTGAKHDRNGSETRPNTTPLFPAVLPLIPNEVPGRITRKARQYEAAIAELHAQGYTLAAICRTLAAAGVHVSRSTVFREVSRQAVPAPSTSPRALSSALPASSRYPSTPIASPVARATPAASLRAASHPVPPSAKDEAEAFVRTHTTNPLVRAKEQS